MTIKLPDLPYAIEALEPHISGRTLEFHHGKHHQIYVTNLNNLIQETALAEASLEEIILQSSGKDDKVGIFNNAAQVWNHTFYWNSMRPGGGGAPTGALKAKIDGAFGSYDIFCDEFKKAATTQFGSGWAWLVEDSGELRIVKTANAETPITQDLKPLLTCDVWEHAYYLDYQNRRPDYVGVFLKNLLNWEFAQQNIEKKAA
ncbi:MAG: superoxide dismutase [Alphaproteobacteria bacterium]|jgi:superoxide dismutase, Fe-Mn family|nr:superoxide dismutase [Alphaproteobacteria bacterium]MBT5389481.1 superoxide dismutase [Alphaproteobacteria bacterium]MBT5540158.1 superoxide dismutase [Alphaproteobacteria bacterium]MBT5655121.1 superoxide dismutase [Alphaproteobacteria bacterium]